MPDGDRWLFSLGTSVRPTHRLQLDAALGYLNLQESRLDSDATAYAGTPVVTPINMQGRVTGDAFILSTGAKLRF